jgi:hypothetical protein
MHGVSGGARYPPLSEICLLTTSSRQIPQVRGLLQRLGYPIDFRTAGVLKATRF